MFKCIKFILLFLSVGPACAGQWLPDLYEICGPRLRAEFGFPALPEAPVDLPHRALSFVRAHGRELVATGAAGLALVVSQFIVDRGVEHVNERYGHMHAMPWLLASTADVVEHFVYPVVYGLVYEVVAAPQGVPAEFCNALTFGMKRMSVLSRKRFVERTPVLARFGVPISSNEQDLSNLENIGHMTKIVEGVCMLINHRLGRYAMTAMACVRDAAAPAHEGIGSICGRIVHAVIGSFSSWPELTELGSRAGMAAFVRQAVLELMGQTAVTRAIMPRIAPVIDAHVAPDVHDGMFLARIACERCYDEIAQHVPAEADPESVEWRRRGHACRERVLEWRDRSRGRVCKKHITSELYDRLIDRLLALRLAYEPRPMLDLFEQMTPFMTSVSALEQEQFVAGVVDPDVAERGKSDLERRLLVAVPEAAREELVGLFDRLGRAARRKMRYELELHACAKTTAAQDEFVREAQAFKDWLIAQLGPGPGNPALPIFRQYVTALQRFVGRVSTDDIVRTFNTVLRPQHIERLLTPHMPMWEAFLARMPFLGEGLRDRFVAFINLLIQKQVRDIQVRRLGMRLGRWLQAALEAHDGAEVVFDEKTLNSEIASAKARYFDL